MYHVSKVTRKIHKFVKRFMCCLKRKRIFLFLDLPSSGTIKLTIFESQGCVNTRKLAELNEENCYNKKIPFSEKVHRQVQKQIIHDGLKVNILSTSVIYHLNNMLQYSFICPYGYILFLLLSQVLVIFICLDSVFIHPVIVLLLYDEFCILVFHFCYSYKCLLMFLSIYTTLLCN